MSENERERPVVNLSPSTENTIIFVILAMIIFFMSIWFLGGLIGLTVADRINAIGAFGSIALSFALFVAYLLLVNVQGEQLKVAQKQQDIDTRLADLQEEQQQYIKANHEPKVVVTDWEVSRTRKGGDLLRVTLRNQGNGLAQNLRINHSVRKVYSDTHGVARTEIVGLSPNSQSQRYVPKKSRLSPQNINRGSTGDFALTAETDPQQFVTELSIIESHISGHPSGEILTTEHSISDMMENDPDGIDYQVVFELLYDDILGNQNQDTFFQSKISRDGEKRFSTLVSERNI